MVDEPRSLAWWPSLYEPFHTLGTRIAEWFSPPAEALSNDDDYVIRTELPGVSIEDVELMVDDGVLTLKGEKKSEREETGETYFFSERRYGAFARRFQLPRDVDAAHIEASMKDGVLIIRAPRTGPKLRGKDIEIKAA